MQREMPIFAALREPTLVSQELIKTCRHRLDAIVLCVQISKLSHEEIAVRLGIDKGHWSRIMQGRAWFPDPKANELMRVCGNFAPLQYEAWSNGFELVAQAKDQRIKELEAQLESLKKIA